LYLIKHPFPPIVFLIITLIVAPFVITTGQAYANGRATLLVSQEKGPYKIDVSVLPSQPVVNNTHVSVLLMSKSDDTPIIDADVVVSATGPQNGVSIGPYQAVNDLVPQFFETTLPFSTQGLWNVQITVSSDLGEESISVLFDVVLGSGMNWIMVSAVVVAILAAGIFIWDKLPLNKRSSNSSARKR
tara:strand:+ start:349 stop:909 length:561 start_codon:yes stop_codon:yes gene_type:complete